MNTPEWMIYGAYGFSGERITRLAHSLNLKPVLAGRNRKRLDELAGELGLKTRHIDIAADADQNSPLDEQNIERIAAALHGIKLVLNCAGPFTSTAPALARAALLAGCHYLDITGELEVFEDLYNLNEQAHAAGVVLMPGVGFDVVPTDCLARQLKSELPNADTLELAFMGNLKPSAGSMKTAVKALPHGSKILHAGKLKTIPYFSRKRQLAAEGKRYTVYSIPWGDVLTASYSTGIKNITVYTNFNELEAGLTQLAMPAATLLKIQTILNGANSLIDMFFSNPDQSYLDSEELYVWGEVSNTDGEKKTAWLKLINTIAFTSQCAVLCVEKTLAGSTKPGFQTAPGLFGHDLVYEIRGSRRL